MTNEKMLEYLMLDKILFKYDGNYTSEAEDLIDEDSGTYDNMLNRMLELEDEFVDEFKTTPTSITDPLQDNK